jgi:hypothetical protein
MFKKLKNIYDLKIQKKNIKKNEKNAKLYEYELVEPNYICLYNYEPKSNTEIGIEKDDPLIKIDDVNYLHSPQWIYVYNFRIKVKNIILLRITSFRIKF